MTDDRRRKGLSGVLDLIRLLWNCKQEGLSGIARVIPAYTASRRTCLVPSLLVMAIANQC